MPLPANFHELDADALRHLLIAQDRELTWRQSKIDQLTHELSLHKRWRFPAQIRVDKGGGIGHSRLSY